VLIHDETVDRTSDGTGAVADMTLAELQELDFGYWFTTDDGATYPYRGQGHGIVTLEGLFSTFDGGIRFGLEIKQASTEAAVDMCNTIVAHGYQDRVLVSSFSQETMDVFRETCPDVATSATEGEVAVFFIIHKLDLIECLRPDYEALQVPETQYGITILSQRFVDDAHSLGLGVIPWTIDDPEDMARIDGLGVEGINTNRPDLLVGLAD
jgi:glycerophosphoryl diester phosphodiesterase